MNNRLYLGTVVFPLLTVGSHVYVERCKALDFCPSSYSADPEPIYLLSSSTSAAVVDDIAQTRFTPAYSQYLT